MSMVGRKKIDLGGIEWMDIEDQSQCPRKE